MFIVLFCLYFQCFFGLCVAETSEKRYESPSCSSRSRRRSCCRMSPSSSPRVNSWWQLPPFRTRTTSATRWSPNSYDKKGWYSCTLDKFFLLTSSWAFNSACMFIQLPMYIRSLLTRMSSLLSFWIEHAGLMIWNLWLNIVARRATRGRRELFRYVLRLF